MKLTHLALIVVMGGACLGAFLTSSTLHAADLPQSKAAQHYTLVVE